MEDRRRRATGIGQQEEKKQTDYLTPDYLTPDA